MKGLLKSKTFWVNAITLSISLATALQGADFVVANPEIVAAIGVAVSALNIVLRLITKVPVKGLV